MRERARREAEDRRCRFFASSSLLSHGAEGDGVTGRFDRGDAVLPFPPRRARHQIERPWFCIEGKALPLRPQWPAEAELAGRAERQAEDAVELRLVAMPADA